ncbi:MAG TPA: hypothetical protein VG204_02345 [Terriglobia bacterium]|nr:hypothetical protein [Terriglobia bacterium]
MQNSKRVVAYVPFKTFLSAIEALEHGVPHQIDTSVWPSFSGAIQSQLLGAFKFLALIDDSGKPTLNLKSLVEKKGERKAVFRKILEASYSRIVGLGLKNISPKQFDEAMRGYGMTGETHKKVLSFFLQAAKYSELPISPLLGKKTRLGGRSKTADSSQGADRSLLPPSQPAEISRRVDLRTGGRVTVIVEGNLLKMGTEDRQLLFDLIDKLDGYEKPPKAKN